MEPNFFFIRFTFAFRCTYVYACILYALLNIKLKTFGFTVSFTYKAIV